MRNVLILSVSTLAISEKGTISPSYFDLQDESNIKYYQQQEPVVTKLFREKNLDCVIALTTEATKKEEHFEKNDIKEEFIISTYEYLKKQFPDIEFIDVDIDDKNPSEGIIGIVKTLRILNKENDIKFWVDMHGGLRDIQIVFQSILSLLSYEKLVPECIYTVKYDSKIKKGIIDEVNHSYQINDLVSGINEFLNTGKGDRLKKYIDSQEEKNYDLVKHIQGISDAILLCDMKAFDKEIVSLSQWMAKREEDIKNNQVKQNYIDLFIQYVRADYGELLDTSKCTVLKKIGWCLNKDLIQQALTLIESQMPEEIVGSDYFKVDWEEEKETSKNNGEENIKVSLEHAIKRAIPAWEHKENGILRKWAEMPKNHVLKFNYDGNKREIDYLTLTGNLSKKNNKQYNWDRLLDDKEMDYRFNLKFDETNNDRNYSYNVEIKTNPDSRKQKLFKLFIRLHMSLKNQRNLANHGSEDERVTVEKVKDAIEAYISLAEELGIK